LVLLAAPAWAQSSTNRAVRGRDWHRVELFGGFSGESPASKSLDFPGAYPILPLEQFNTTATPPKLGGTEVSATVNLKSWLGMEGSFSYLRWGHTTVETFASQVPGSLGPAVPFASAPFPTRRVEAAGGPRYAYRRRSISLFVHVLAGWDRISWSDTYGPLPSTTLLNRGAGPLVSCPSGLAYDSLLGLCEPQIKPSVSPTNFAVIVLGGGADVRITSHVAARAGVDYAVPISTQGNTYGGVRVSLGVAFKFW
jgi:hypothetical protein